VFYTTVVGIDKYNGILPNEIKNPQSFLEWVGTILAYVVGWTILMGAVLMLEVIVLVYALLLSFWGIWSLNGITNLNAQADVQGCFGNIRTVTKMGVARLSYRWTEIVTSILGWRG
jgi:uncharacterized membrane protein YfbV (UPF0208 family)